MSGENDHAQTAAPSAEGATATPATPAAADHPTPAAGEGSGTGTPVSLKDAVTKALAQDDDAPLPQPADHANDEGADAANGEDEGAGSGEGEGAEGAEGAEDGAAGGDGADPDLVAPEGISTKARERFDKLVDRVKQGDARYSELDGKFRGIEATLKGTGATPEQWGRVLTAMRYANSGDPQQARQALELLDGYRAEIAAIAGVPVQGVDVLADFPDLRASVEAGDLDEKFAAELAASRRAQTRTRNQATEREAQERASTELQQRQDTAKNGLNELGLQLGKSDVDYQRKVQILESRGVIDNIVKNVPPEAWKDSFKAAYDALGDVTARVPAPKPGEQPMRRSGKSGSGAQAQPKTVSEAVRMAIADE